MEEPKSKKNGCLSTAAVIIAIISMIFGFIAYESGHFHGAANFYCCSSLFLLWKVLGLY